MRRDRVIWMAVFLALFASAWAYALTLKATSAVQTTLLPLDLRVRPSPASPVRPLPGVGAPADPFAPGPLASSPTAPVPAPVPLPPPPVPELPPDPAAAQPPESVASPPFKVTGIVSGAVRRAVLEAKDTAYIVKEGDVVEGWTVVRIEPRRLILKGPSGDEFVLELEESTGRGN